MANQLDMASLSLKDSQHANGSLPMGRSTYIPPHLRGRGGPPPMGQMDGPASGPSPAAAEPGLGGSAWGPTP